MEACFTQKTGNLNFILCTNSSLFKDFNASASASASIDVVGSSDVLPSSVVTFY